MTITMKTAAAGILLALSTAAGAQATAPDADALWRGYWVDGRYERTNEAYQALGAVQYDYEAVDAARCRESAGVLSAAVRDVPVGLALRHAALLCAEALGDEAQADAHTEALSVLVRHAARSAGSAPWRLPIRVVRPDDVGTFLQIGGLEHRYAYYADLWPEGGLPLHVAAYDPSTRKESHIAFDWVDTLARLKSDDPLQGYFIDRHLIANAFLEAWASDDDIAAVDLLAIRQTMMEDTPEARRDRLKAAAGRGGVLAAQTWLELCSQSPFAGCADGFVDAVLPLAEKGHAVSRVQLALAYLRGLGVSRDAEAARTLIEAADRSWEDAAALVQAASVLDLAKVPRPEWLEAALAEAESKGSSAARALRVARDAARAPAAIAPADLKWLALPAHNLAGRGYALLAAAAESAKSDTAGEWRERAAAAGDAASMRIRAVQVLQDTPTDPPATERLREAALRGDAFAARGMAYQALREGKAAQARDWLLGKVTEGDVDALLMLAGVYESGYEGLGKGPADAADIYEDLASDVPDARRKLALMLVEGHGIPKDHARARKLLEQDPKDMRSLSMLGSLLVRERIAGDVAGGRVLLDAAVAAGDDEAIADYGLWLANNEATPEGRKRGLDMLARADVGGTERTRTNNLAWLRCVSRHDDVRDPRAGVELAKRLGPPENLESGLIDTVAACEAAAGRQREAVHLQSLALSKLPPGKVFEATREGMQSRLELYRAGGRYIEPAPSGD